MTIKIFDGAPPEVFAIARMIEHLPDGAEPTLVILKGHLLIEEQLRELLASKMTASGHLKDAALEFDQCLWIGRALTGDQHPEWVWIAMKKLNKIRNDLAHNLEPRGVNDRVRDFIRYVKANELPPPDGELERNMSLLSYSIASLFMHFMAGNKLKRRKIAKT